jgi:hypothetical protein
MPPIRATRTCSMSWALYKRQRQDWADARESFTAALQINPTLPAHICTWATASFIRAIAAEYCCDAASARA